MSIGCFERRNKLAAYDDGELDSRERAEIEGHLSTCRPCADELSAYQRTWAEFLQAHQPRRTPKFPRWRVIEAAAGPLVPPSSTVAVRRVGFYAGIVAMMALFALPLH